jgi:hypothetical protein
MKFYVLAGLLFSLFVTTQSAQAVQQIELKETPPPQPLHYCQDSAGGVTYQADPCEQGKTEVSSITTIRDGKVIRAPLGETLETWNPDAKKSQSSVAGPDTSAAAENAASQPTHHKSLQVQIITLFFVSLVVSIISAKRGRSGILTFLVCVLGGFLLNAMITAAGTGVGGTAAMIGSFAVPAVMLLRSLSSNNE